MSKENDRKVLIIQEVDLLRVQNLNLRTATLEAEAKLAQQQINAVLAQIQADSAALKSAWVHKYGYTWDQLEINPDGIATPHTSEPAQS